MPLGSEVEGNQVSVDGDQFHRLCFPAHGIATHAGGVIGHSGQRQSDRIRLIIEESENRSGRHMTLDHVPVDEGRVARCRAGRHPVFGLEIGQLPIFSEINAGSKLLQVPDPPSAASSTGFLVHLEGNAGEVGSSCLNLSFCSGGGGSRRFVAAAGRDGQHDECEPTQPG